MEGSKDAIRLNIGKQILIQPVEKRTSTPPDPSASVATYSTTDRKAKSTNSDALKKRKCFAVQKEQESTDVLHVKTISGSEFPRSISTPCFFQMSFMVISENKCQFCVK